MQNFAKTSIVKYLIKYFFLFLFFSPLSQADEVTKINFDNGHCYKLLNFHECTFNDGFRRIGQIDNSGKWNKNVKEIYKNGNVAYLYYRSGEIGYGVQYYDNGFYVGDLSSNGAYYGLGSYYFENGEKWSFQNWQDENKIGYFQYSSGSKLIGRFDKDYNLLIEIPLNKDFQLKLNNMELLARSVEIDFKNEYEKFLVKKSLYLSNSTEKKSINTSNNTSSTSSTKSATESDKVNNQNLYIGLGILFLFIVIILWKNASPSKITQTETKESQSRKDKQEEIERYKNLSLADSRKLFSYGVKEFMSVPEACRQLRSEYFKWTTVSNNPDGLKKSLSQKNMNNIIRLRKKLEC